MLYIKNIGSQIHVFFLISIFYSHKGLVLFFISSLDIKKLILSFSFLNKFYFHITFSINKPNYCDLNFLLFFKSENSVTGK